MENCLFPRANDFIIFSRWEAGYEGGGQSVSGHFNEQWRQGGNGDNGDLTSQSWIDQELGNDREMWLLWICLLAAAVFKPGKTQSRNMHILRCHNCWETRVKDALLLDMKEA